MPKKIIIDNIPVFQINENSHNYFFQLDDDQEHWSYEYAIKLEKQLLPENWRDKEHRFNKFDEAFYLTGMELISDKGLGARICADIFLEFGMILDRTVNLKEHTIYKFRHLLMEDGSGTEVNIQIV